MDDGGRQTTDGGQMSFKFERLEVWRMALDYIDATYALAGLLPKSEEYNLKSQLTRAATSIALNIAEGSTGQTDAEQARFVGLAVRSLVETVACLRIIRRRALVTNEALLSNSENGAESLFAKLQAFRKAIAPNQNWVREDRETYVTTTSEPLSE
jgi:four helix bundle protein